MNRRVCMTKTPTTDDGDPERRVPSAEGHGARSPIALASEGVSGMDPLLEAKLWRNPCWFAFRINYIAFRYNQPLYTWVEQTYDLSRPEFTVIYSLGIGGGHKASQITRSSGHPKNTLSRAIAKLESRGLIQRDAGPGTGRNQLLRLTRQGHALFDAALPKFVEHERRLLSGITEDERAALARILAKVVLSSHDWPTDLTGSKPDAEVTEE